MPPRMRMRWAAYAGFSTALAGGVILKALAQRPNFYSAAVYLSQSSANLMILTNLLFVVACTFLLGLQKLLYGNLRPIEIEQLYEKAWFAVTETCLAMTVFRGELGLPFLAMFFALLTGKVWGWIGEGRVEILEQQPPRNPRLFHTRLALSLGLSVAFDLTMLEYVVKQVMKMARPDMMVMFGFEFAVLSITSIGTAARYAVNLVEIGILREQKRQRIDQLKRERAQAAVAEFQEAQTREDATTSTTGTTTAVPTPTQRTVEQVREEALNQPVDEAEVEVEGWEEKGRYMFYLNLATDFFKLVIYLAFFFILLVFYGLPIHILRDVFLTMRSFLKRISDFMKYRAATRDMNARYPDATAEDIGREDVCIICREEMHPYQPAVPQDGQPQPAPNPVAERMRPKKLPCGHVLHFSCLRSWLERQQICPTCRANVVRPVGTQGGTDNAGGGAGAPGAGGQPRPDRQGPRVYQLGPLRIGVGAARGNNMFEELQQQLAQVAGAPHPPANPNPDPNAPRQFGVGFRWSRGRGRPGDTIMTTENHLDALGQQIQREVNDLARNSAELTLLRSMQAELQRLRATRGMPIQAAGTPQPTQGTGAANANLAASSSNNLQSGQWNVTRLEGGGQQDVIQAGSDRLPPGLTLPEGWSIMPLNPVQNTTSMQWPSAPNNAIPGLPPWPVQFPGFPGGQVFPGAVPPFNAPFAGFPAPFANRTAPNAMNNVPTAQPQGNGLQAAGQVPPAAGPQFPPGIPLQANAQGIALPTWPQVAQDPAGGVGGDQPRDEAAPSMFAQTADDRRPDIEVTNPTLAGDHPDGTSTGDADPTQAVNGDQNTPQSSFPNSQPLPSWGFGASTGAGGGSNSASASRPNSSHNGDSTHHEQSASQASEANPKSATVEDLVEDPD
ncbi:E3 ubiquitin-protein ligase hrd1 [Elasticomyces elasticus]|uniref:RING-type E3 ubiquitin transferase n=1 Tax=Exophiala sideris TaxID=1016849 RepID=A0ABR0IWY4_9EURO|nr:E3 ubiquitin-protein ligase hrd1 [Elasticomyces elasticus]KAK5021763.1 E3 ubiquitin-protein ligase hrd1 [Exophiala sideris]KAK5025877.1 E3 ubiquitin-protein ligase hrd1 [Exophiala sideris]KAK5050241.1 E3 ubiquitin-protein ligase hrd1 [Exophiala sideris]KAK5177000.1 E3 ubiquitin-protein ligase hrd1 [Eurotiomycetes sp. CCFEE 6388]